MDTVDLSPDGADGGAGAGSPRMGGLAAARAARAAFEAAQASFDACVDELTRRARRRTQAGTVPFPDQGAAMRAYLEAAVILRRARRVWRQRVLDEQRARAGGPARPGGAATPRPPKRVNAPAARGRTAGSSILQPFGEAELPRLRFARWLVETGRLTDHPIGPQD